MTKKSKTEVAIVDDARVAALRAASGASDTEGAKWPNKVRVNRRPIDEDDNPLPMGKYVLKVGDVDHYMTTADMIVIEKGTQFIRFVGEGKKSVYVGCTMIENGFNPEYKDTLGGERLGRKSGMAFDEMTDAQKEVKFYFHMLGVIDVSQAVDGSGKALYDGKTAVFEPAALQFKGKKSVEKQEEFKKLKKKGEAYFDFITRLSKPHKAGDVDGIPFYDFHFERGDSVPLTSDILDSVEAVKSLIETENRRIYKKHLAAQSAVVSDTVEEASYTDLDLPDED